MNKFTYIDFHTHSLRKTKEDILEIVSVHPGRDREKHFYTSGYHPWWTDHLLTDEEIDHLRQCYTQDDHCIAIGEFGLDKLKGPSIELQSKIVRQHLDLAKELNAPVILHCVRAYHQLLEIKKDYPSIKTWIIHGYARHKTLAKELIDKGFLLSISPTATRRDFHESLSYVPIDRIFLETDGHPDIKIEDVYHITSEIKSINLEILNQQMHDNLARHFPLLSKST